jgi:transposase
VSQRCLASDTSAGSEASPRSHPGPEARDLIGACTGDVTRHSTSSVDLTPVGGQTRVSEVNAEEGRAQNAGSDTFSYPPEFKREAVRLVHSSPNRSLAQIARELGVSDNSLRSWVKQTEIDAGEREGLTTEEREELRKLRKEVKVLRHRSESSFEKPCKAFFAREDGI